VDGLEERNAKGVAGRVDLEDWWQVTCQSRRCRRVYRGRADSLVEIVKAARAAGEAVVLRSGVSYGVAAAD